MDDGMHILLNQNQVGIFIGSTFADRQLMVTVDVMRSHCLPSDSTFAALRRIQ